jgi:hypothetical protein
MLPNSVTAARAENPSMKRILFGCALAAAFIVALSGTALAWQVCGRVTCNANSLPLEGIVVQVSGGSFVHAAATDANGEYCIALPDVPGSFTSTLLLYNGEQIASPAGGSYQFSTTAADNQFTQDWGVVAEGCGEQEESLCWLTGGGAKFSPITSDYVGDSDKWNNFGGNVYPGCSATAGDGGNWNHIANNQSLHFQGRNITVVRCGNMPGIPPGSTSPVTGVNFIDFTGTGRLKGIKSNKTDIDPVYFFAHCEDRNEPGSNGQRDGAGKDRYFLHVYSNPANPNGSTLLLVDLDRDPSTVDPVTITDGNLQLHASSCAPAAHAGRSNGEVGASGTTAPAVSASAKKTTWGQLKLIYR